MGRGESLPVPHWLHPGVTICPVFPGWGAFGAETGKATDSGVSANFLTIICVQKGSVNSEKTVWTSFMSKQGKNGTKTDKKERKSLR